MSVCVEKLQITRLKNDKNEGDGNRSKMRNENSN